MTYMYGMGKLPAPYDPLLERISYEEYSLLVKILCVNDLISQSINIIRQIPNQMKVTFKKCL